MLSEGDSVARASYLGVSVFANTVAEALLGLSLREKAEYTKVLDDAIGVLKAVESGDPSNAMTAAGLRPFRGYHQRVTLLSVLKSSSLDDARSKISRIIGILEAQKDKPATLDEEQRKEVVRIFLKLASEAQYSFHRPPAGVPQAVRELCQQGTTM